MSDSQTPPKYNSFLEEKHSSQSDHLNRQSFVETLFETIIKLDRGKVISIEGDWGAGKTWILYALKKVAFKYRREHNNSSDSRGIYFLNPWQYKEPDLISALIEKMLNDVTEINSDTKKKFDKKQFIKDIAPFLLSSILSLTGAGIVFQNALKLVSNRFSKWWKKTEFESMDFTLDATAVAGEAFDRLANELSCSLRNDEERLPPIIFVDDIDRCLPHHQVSILEALHFLTAFGSRAIFIVAMDPKLAIAAIQTHYSSSIFDGDAYLQKLFNLRVRVPTSSTLIDVLRNELNRFNLDISIPNDHVTSLKKAFPNIGPRDMHRIASRLLLASISNIEANELVWHYICDKHPQLRYLITQATEKTLTNLCLWSGASDVKHFEIIHPPENRPLRMTVNSVLTNIPSFKDLSSKHIWNESTLARANHLELFKILFSPMVKEQVSPPGARNKVNEIVKESQKKLLKFDDECRKKGL